MSPSHSAHHPELLLLLSIDGTFHTEEHRLWSQVTWVKKHHLFQVTFIDKTVMLLS
jgi:hypothetical protein